MCQIPYYTPRGRWEDKTEIPVLMGLLAQRRRHTLNASLQNALHSTLMHTASTQQLAVSMILNFLKEALCKKILMAKVTHQIISVFKADLFRET